MLRDSSIHALSVCLSGTVGSAQSCAHIEQKAPPRITEALVVLFAYTWPGVGHLYLLVGAFNHLPVVLHGIYPQFDEGPGRGSEVRIPL